jgi:Holliday junction resolvasome RuvABC DNA-binding subunit
VELKEKLSKVDLGERRELKDKEAAVAPAQEEAIMALVSLGYTKPDAKRALEAVMAKVKEPLPVEELIKRALSHAR